eukprot:5318790-Pleurochrysis_carterae.AAC.1
MMRVSFGFDRRDWLGMMCNYANRCLRSLPLHNYAHRSLPALVPNDLARDRPRARRAACAVRTYGQDMAGCVRLHVEIV